MSVVKTPQEKKRLSYAKDHVAKGKHDKGFRRQWPLKEARSKRSERREVSTVLLKALATNADELQTETNSVFRPQVRKWWALTSIDNIAQRRGRREVAHEASIARAMHCHKKA